MNGPFVVAQANIGSTSATPVQVLKLIKPPAGQTEILHASSNGTVKIDFSAIANERIVIEKNTKDLSASIKFEDGAVIIIEPFFDSLGTILGNFTFEMGPNVFFSGQEFATRVPITEAGPDVQPAAGPGGTAAGADFHGFSIDGLGLSNPLGLLPPEELGGLKFTNTGTPTLEVEGAPPPPNLVPGFGEPVLGLVEEESVPAGLPSSDAGPGNEDTLDAAGNDEDVPGNPNNTTDHVSGSLAGMVRGGDLALTVNANSAANLHAVIDENGAPVTSLGDQVYYVYVSPTVIEGWTFIGAPSGGNKFDHIFTLEITGDTFTFTLTDQIDHHEVSHDDGSNPQGFFEETLKLDLTEAITAHDATPDVIVLPPHSFEIGVIDDTPVLDIGTNGSATIAVTMDESIVNPTTVLPDGNAGADDTAQTAVNGTDPIGSTTTNAGDIANLFTDVFANAGTDGQKDRDDSYSLVLRDAGG